MFTSKRQAHLGRDRRVEQGRDGDLEQFRKELDSNPALQQELRLQQKVDEALEETDILNFRKQLIEIQEQVVPAFTPGLWRKFAGSRITRIAASVTLLVALAFTFQYYAGSGNRSDKVFSKYYHQYQPLNFRSGSSELDQLYRSGLVAYQNADYETARNYFEKVVTLDKDKMEANILNGASNMELKEYKEASTSFKKVIDQKDNLFIEDAEWYLGLCYIKTKETEKAVKQFTKIARGNSIKNEEARKILKKIK